MSSIEMSSAVKVEHLLNSIKQLSPTELDEFMQKFQKWQQGEVLVDEDVDPKASDAEVIAFIRENSSLPENENRRYWQLRRKSDDETLTDDELPEYQELVRKLTILNTKRIEGMNVLSERWEKPVRQIMTELELVISHFDEPKFAEESTAKDCSQSTSTESPANGKNNAS